MWVQVTRVRPAAQPTAPPGEHFRQNALQRMQQMPGFAGAVMLRSRAERLGATATYWDDRGALDAARDAIEKGRSEAAQTQGFEVLEVEEFEVVLADRKQLPAVGHFVRSTDGHGDPGNREEGTRLIQEKILPLVSGQPGYVSLIVFANPDSGRTVTSSTWESEGSLKSSGEAVMAARDDVAQSIGANVDRIEEWEIVLAELTPRS